MRRVRQTLWIQIWQPTAQFTRSKSKPCYDRFYRAIRLQRHLATICVLHVEMPPQRICLSWGTAISAHTPSLTQEEACRRVRKKWTLQGGPPQLWPFSVVVKISRERFLYWHSVSASMRIESTIDEQSGFRSERGCVEQLFSAGQGTRSTNNARNIIFAFWVWHPLGVGRFGCMYTAIRLEEKRKILMLVCWKQNPISSYLWSCMYLSNDKDVYSGIQWIWRRRVIESTEKECGIIIFSKIRGRFLRAVQSFHVSSMQTERVLGCSVCMSVWMEWILVKRYYRSGRMELVVDSFAVDWSMMHHW